MLQRQVVNVDLKDFFPSIHIGRVIGLFRRAPFEFGKEAAETLAQICCRDDGVLPQGGVTSPMISNLVCRGLDNDLMAFARKRGLRYSRYADDLTFSLRQSLLPRDLLEELAGKIIAGAALDRIVQQHTFQINQSKVSQRDRSRRQSVTGLTVNLFPNVKRSFIRQIEGALHAWG